MTTAMGRSSQGTKGKGTPQTPLAHRGTALSLLSGHRGRKWTGPLTVPGSASHCRGTRKTLPSKALGCPRLRKKNSFQKQVVTIRPIH